MKITLFSFLLLIISFSLFAMPTINVINKVNLEGFAQIQVKNETKRALACYVSINGFKKKFRLPSRMTSKWYTANDKRFKHTDFSVWCDFLEFHPQYKNLKH